MHSYAAFTNADDARTQSICEIHVLFKCIIRAVVLKCREETGKPHVADLQTAQIESLFEHIKILWILAATLAALISGQCHFAQALLIGQFTAQRGQIVICPVDRRTAKLYFHMYSP